MSRITQPAGWILLFVDCRQSSNLTGLPDWPRPFSPARRGPDCMEVVASRHQPRSGWGVDSCVVASHQQPTLACPEHRSHRRGCGIWPPSMRCRGVVLTRCGSLVPGAVRWSTRLWCKRGLDLVRFPCEMEGRKGGSSGMKVSMEEDHSHITTRVSWSPK